LVPFLKKIGLAKDLFILKYEKNTEYFII
jgi:hypothetical protein